MGKIKSIHRRRPEDAPRRREEKKVFYFPIGAFYSNRIGRLCCVYVRKKGLNDRQVCVLSGSAASVSARAVAVGVFVAPHCRTGRSLFVSVSAPRAHSRRPRHCRPPAPAPSLLRRPRAGRRNGALAEGSATSSTIARSSGALQKRRLGGRVSQTLSRTRTRSSAEPSSGSRRRHPLSVHRDHALLQSQGPSRRSNAQVSPERHAAKGSNPNRRLSLY